MLHTPLFSPPLRGFRSLSAILDDAGVFLRDLDQSVSGPRFYSSSADTPYSLVIELPGFKREHVTVEIETDEVGDRLVVRASKPSGKTADGVEMSHGCVGPRDLYLPSDADPTKVEAKLEDGLLVVTVQKVAKPTPPAPRKVTVS